MKKKSYNYKFIIGLVIGLLSITSVYAASGILSSDIHYDGKYTSLSDGDVQSTIDDLASEIESPTTCLEGYYCEKYKTTLELGDYVSYTPTVTSFTTDTSKTNYSSTQTIYPSELNLWRVLNINEDGTVDLISEYVSSTDVYFKGQLGYQNFVGYLNELAAQYKTDGITVGSRHFGYNEQTLYITDTSMFTNPAPWTSSTGASTVESQGGGDTLYEKDYNQLYTVLGTRVAKKVGTADASSYWMASRYYYYSSSSLYSWYGRSVSTVGYNSNYYLYNYDSSSFYSYRYSHALRPIVTLKSGLKYQGLGTEWYPMEIITN